MRCLVSALRTPALPLLMRRLCPSHFALDLQTSSLISFPVLWEPCVLNTRPLFILSVQCTGAGSREHRYSGLPPALQPETQRKHTQQPASWGNPEKCYLTHAGLTFLPARHGSVEDARQPREPRCSSSCGVFISPSQSRL